MNDWFIAGLAFVALLIALLFSERLLRLQLQHSRFGFAPIRFGITFMIVMVVGAVLVAFYFPKGGPLSYVAYGAVGGIANLLSQALFGNEMLEKSSITRE